MRDSTVRPLPEPGKRETGFEGSVRTRLHDKTSSKTAAGRQWVGSCTVGRIVRSHKHTVAGSIMAFIGKTERCCEGQRHARCCVDWPRGWGRSPPTAGDVNATTDDRDPIRTTPAPAKCILVCIIPLEHTQQNQRRGRRVLTVFFSQRKW